MPNHTNRLTGEKSPYLQQHAHNPVNWWPWGPDALAAARDQDKPIFLSIGYSTCHWCHVMAHECFENQEIAALMNEGFINIKIDREERPDIDAIYMSAVQALTGSGGWPMSVWLTPDLKPFYAGTYFPPEDRYGRPGFPTVLIQLTEIYAKERERIAQASEDITNVLQQSANASFRKKSELPSAVPAMKLAAESLSAGYDANQGGFSPAPKFPMPVYLDFLLYYHARTKSPNALEMVANTVRKMAEGGIYDQLGGGFARYSTDTRWLVPHFEKMLYDNAQLLRVLAPLAVETGDPLFKRVALETAAYLQRDLRHPDGAFFSAEDADSEGKEGTFYVWTYAELKKVLGDDADFAASAFGVSVAGNFMDPHTREPGLNVLSVAKPLNELESQRLLLIKKKLFDHRARRPRPHRDEKIITEWNGLAISALARAGFLLNEPTLLTQAAQAASFVGKNLWDGADKRLYRRWCDGERGIAGQQADYAMLVEGLLDLFETDAKARWLELAVELQEAQDHRFFDSELGGYFMAESSPDLLVRMKEDGDNVIPGGNSVAAMNGLRLTALTGRPEFRERAISTLRLFGSSLTERPFTVARMLPALDWEQTGHVQVVVVSADANDTSTVAMTNVLRRRPSTPQQMVILNVVQKAALAHLMPHLVTMNPADGKATAFVCRDFTCREPLSDPKKMADLLNVSA